MSYAAWMKGDRKARRRLWMVALALLVLAGCSRRAAVDAPFSLREGETVRVSGTGLALEIEQIGNQQPGSQETMDGFVFLRVTVEDEGPRTVYLEVGEKKEVGEYEIHLEDVVPDAEGWRCELVVTAEGWGECCQAEGMRQAAMPMLTIRHRFYVDSAEGANGSSRGG